MSKNSEVQKQRDLKCFFSFLIFQVIKYFKYEHLCFLPGFKLDF